MTVLLKLHLAAVSKIAIVLSVCCMAAAFYDNSASTTTMYQSSSAAPRPTPSGVRGIHDQKLARACLKSLKVQRDKECIMNAYNSGLSDFEVRQSSSSITAVDTS